MTFVEDVFYVIWHMLDLVLNDLSDPQTLSHLNGLVHVAGKLQATHLLVISVADLLGH